MGSDYKTLINCKLNHGPRLSTAQSERIFFITEFHDDATLFSNQAECYPSSKPDCFCHLVFISAIKTITKFLSEGEL